MECSTQSLSKGGTVAGVLDGAGGGSGIWEGDKTKTAILTVAALESDILGNVVKQISSEDSSK